VLPESGRLDLAGSTLALAGAASLAVVAEEGKKHEIYKNHNGYDPVNYQRLGGLNPVQPKMKCKTSLLATSDSDLLARIARERLTGLLRSVASVGADERDAVEVVPPEILLLDDGRDQVEPEK